MQVRYAASAALLAIIMVSGHLRGQTRDAGRPEQAPPASRAAARPPAPGSTTALLQRVRKSTLFVDLHAHPSHIHRGNALRIEERELDNYRRGQIDVVLAKVTPDGFYGGNYYLPDGTYVGGVGNNRRTPGPGEVLQYTRTQLSKIARTVETGAAVLARTPAEARAAQASGKVAIVASLEGGDGLYPSVDNLRLLYREHGVRVLQIVHLVPNEIGMSQSAFSWLPGGLTEFGKQIVREANSLGVVIDLAHSGHQTILDTLALTRHPVIFSHTGAMSLISNPRHLTDDEIRAIAKVGGVIGVWPNAAVNPHVREMVNHIDYIRQLVGIDHVGIGSDLRGLDSQGYSEGFGRGRPPESAKGLPVTTPEEVNFLAIVEELLARGYTEDEVGKVMGGNFVRVWETVTSGKETTRTAGR